MRNWRIWITAYLRTPEIPKTPLAGGLWLALAGENFVRGLAEQVGVAG